MLPLLRSGLRINRTEICSDCAANLNIYGVDSLCGLGAPALPHTSANEKKIVNLHKAAASSTEFSISKASIETHWLISDDPRVRPDDGLLVQTFQKNIFSDERHLYT